MICSLGESFTEPGAEKNYERSTRGPQAGSPRGVLGNHTKRHERDPSFGVVSCPFVDRFDLFAKVGFFDSRIGGEFFRGSFHNDAASL